MAFNLSENYGLFCVRVTKSCLWIQEPKQKLVEGLLIEKESNVLEPPRCTGEVDLARLWMPQGMEK